MRARLITDDIDKIKLQQKDLSKAITMMETELNECMQLAEKKKGLSYMIKSNALKRKKVTNKERTFLFAKGDCRPWNEKERNGLIYIW